MKNSAFLLLLFLSFSFETFAQEINNYKYVLVPKQFEFQSEPNQYQLNALTGFLFEKQGFEVIFGEEIPEGIEPCSVLTADMESESGLFNSKVILSLQDCNEQIVFKSKKGKSGEKDFKKSYQLALRDAFKSVEDLNYSYQPQKSVLTEKRNPEVTVEMAENEVLAEVERVEEEQVEKINRQKLINGNTVYWLEKNPSGFFLFKGGERFATLLKSNSGSNYIYASENIQGAAFFDEEGNLLVEYVDPVSSQLVLLKYQVQD